MTSNQIARELLRRSSACHAARGNVSTRCAACTLLFNNLERMGRLDASRVNLWIRSAKPLVERLYKHT